MPIKLLTKTIINKQSYKQTRNNTSQAVAGPRNNTKATKTVNFRLHFAEPNDATFKKNFAVSRNLFRIRIVLNRFRQLVQSSIQK